MTKLTLSIDANVKLFIGDLFAYSSSKTALNDSRIGNMWVLSVILGYDQSFFN